MADSTPLSDGPYLDDRPSPTTDRADPGLRIKRKSIRRGLAGGSPWSEQDKLDILGEGRWHGLSRSKSGVRLRTLTFVRWLAVVGQLIAIIIVHGIMDYKLPLVPVCLAISASVVLNIVLSFRFPANARATGRQAGLQMVYDLAQLSTLLFLTGGLQNPFSVLLLVPATIAATFVSFRGIIAIVLFALACASVLAMYHLPLPWGGEPLQFSRTFLIGVWVAISFSMAFLSGYAWRVSAEGRRRSQALIATQAALAREQKLSALGGLAAAAAHELGSPLGTINLIAKDLVRDHGDDPELREDLEVLAAQAMRCGRILSHLSTRSEEAETHLKRITIDGLLHEAARPMRDAGAQIDVQSEAAPSATKDAPTLERKPEVLHALRNFIDNGARLAKTKVNVHAYWDDEYLWVQIIDDGPGFDADVLNSMGEPFLRSRTSPRRKQIDDKRGEGMGLGIFIATTLLDRTGADISFYNRGQNGAVVEISWRSDDIETEGELWDS